MSKDWTQEKAFEALESEITTLRADNERLRAALQEVKPLVLGATHSEARYPKARALIVAHPIGEKHDMQIDSMVTISGAEYEALRAENERLREALAQLLACPAIADGNHSEPAWACHETAAAETFARKALARAALEGKDD